jgi:hypothetical protein
VRIVTCLPAASVVVICRHSTKPHGGQWQVPVPPAEDQRGVDARGKGEVLAADGAVTTRSAEIPALAQLHSGHLQQDIDALLGDAHRLIPIVLLWPSRPIGLDARDSADRRRQASRFATALHPNEMPP